MGDSIKKKKTRRKRRSSNRAIFNSGSKNIGSSSYSANNGYNNSLDGSYYDVIDDSSDEQYEKDISEDRKSKTSSFDESMDIVGYKKTMHEDENSSNESTDNDSMASGVSYENVLSFSDESDNSRVLNDRDGNNSGSRPNFKHSSPQSFTVSHPDIEQQSSSEESECSISSESKANQIQHFLEPTEGLMLLVMPVPSAVTFYGQAHIRVLSGTVNICGFSISDTSRKFYSIFSADKIFSLQIQAQSYERISNQCVRETESFLKNNFNSQVTDILNFFKFPYAVVILKQFQFTHGVDFVSLYHPEIFSPAENSDKETKIMHRFRKFHFDLEGLPFNEPQSYVSLGDAVIKEIECRERNIESNPSESAACIFVYGSKGTGKSSLLRYLINRVLSTNSEKVMYLNLDPGQTEFTPPACLSLNEVTEPLLGPAFTHIKNPVMQVFYGSVAIEPSQYFNICVRNLYSFYRQNYGNVPLFVNMFGWLEGIGKELLDFTMNIINPTFEVKLIPKKNQSSKGSQISDLSESNKTKVVLESARVKKSPCKPGVYLRELSVLAYLGQCQPYYDAPMYLTCFKPYKVKVKDIVIHLMHYNVEHSLLMQAVNATMVALCKVEHENILVCGAEDHSKCPKALKDPECLGVCVGFGFVRAIDEKNGILYFVSPVQPEKLCKVNAFIKGNVHTPDQLMRKQGIYGVPLPYSKILTAKKDLCQQIYSNN